jgi:hypothetical protein
MTEPKTRTYTLKTGKIRAAIDIGVELELTMRRVTTPERLRHQPLEGRAAQDLQLWAEALLPVATYEAELESYEAARARCDETGEELELVCPEHDPALDASLHELDPEIWEAVAEAIHGLTAIARIYQDEEVYEVALRDRADLISQLSPTHLLSALSAALKSRDLTATEKNS